MTVRLTEKEKRSLDRLVEAYGSSGAGVMRAGLKVLGQLDGRTGIQPTQHALLSSEAVADVAGLRLAVNRLGNNLNQAVRRLNSVQDAQTAQEVREQLRFINDTLDKLLGVHLTGGGVDAVH
ncbi:hypothetical protein [Corynebacterium coyleae]|uniref:hypothetical protein n=1 Tax=Corynebacterium coyleae TaxID=53374 RepID=UPI00254A8B28|nr:hypothetical protein [Corynebacterium coyleae]MDK8799338.1 hypothetical protein [Corynebacterium coyleae]